MANNRETTAPALETVGLTTKGLFQIGGFALALAAAGFSFAQWSKHSFDSVIRDYDAGYISPKIAANAWSIAANAHAIQEIRQEQKEFRLEIRKLIESQDYARNRQYGEVKALLTKQEENTNKIINHLLVNK